MMVLPDDDYKLVDGCGWFDVKDFTIRIYSNKYGVGVEIVSLKEMETDSFCEPVAKTFVYYETDSCQA